jgi:hypothetical protein
MPGPLSMASISTPVWGPRVELAQEELPLARMGHEVLAASLTTRATLPCSSSLKRRRAARAAAVRRANPAWLLSVTGINVELTSISSPSPGALTYLGDDLEVVHEPRAPPSPSPMPPPEV